MGGRPFEPGPAEVRAASARDVDFLEETFTHVGDEEVAGCGVEVEAEGIAQAERPDEGTPRRRSGEWIARRHEQRQLWRRAGGER